MLSLNDCDCGTALQPDVTTDKIINYSCSGDCDKCRWFQVGVSQYKCLDCNSTGTYYYMKAVSSNGTIYCRRLGITGFRNKKIIYGSNQIVTSCRELDLYEMGDQCFNREMMYGVDNTITVDSTHEVQCQFKWYPVIQDNSLKYHKCLSKNEDCPLIYHYYDYETRECLNNCPAERSKISILGENKYRCTAECNVDGYDKEYTRRSFLYSKINITFCYKDCPPEAPLFYKDDKKCIQSCYKNELDYFIKDKGCVSDKDECTNYRSYFKINIKSGYKICIDDNIERHFDSFDCPI